MKHHSLEQLYSNYFQLLGSQTFVSHELDYGIFERHLPFLESLDQVTNSAVTVFDLHQKKHIFSSDNLRRLLGVSSGDETDPRIHPQDLPLLLHSGIYFFKVIFGIPSAERRNYKLINNYRIKNSAGEYICVIEQHQLLEADKYGNIWLSLSVLDLSPEQENNLPLKSRVINYKTGDTFYFKEEGEEVSLKLSEREKEVLKLIAQGLVSKQIADKLYISVHTVNTHRQRIIEKLNVSNTFEALSYASELGLLSL